MDGWMDGWKDGGKEGWVGGVNGPMDKEREREHYPLIITLRLMGEKILANHSHAFSSALQSISKQTVAA